MEMDIMVLELYKKAIIKILKKQLTTKKKQSNYNQIIFFF